MMSVPKLIFACSVNLEKYKNEFIHRKDFLELSICEEGRILFEHENGEKEITYPGTVLTTASDLSCRTSSYKNDRQRHTTVGVNMKYALKRYDSESECDVLKLKERIRGGCTALVPYRCDAGTNYNKIIELIKKIIVLNSSENPSDRINAVSEWYALIGFMTDLVLTKLELKRSEAPPSELIYAKKAAQYISENYMNRLTADEISKRLGISSGYLHRIFKRVNGITVLEYINRLRVANAISLMINKNASLKQAAFCVGIEDPAYMSRLFKKTTGLCCREYLRARRDRHGETDEAWASSFNLQ